MAAYRWQRIDPYHFNLMVGDVRFGGVHQVQHSRKWIGEVFVGRPGQVSALSYHEDSPTGRDAAKFWVETTAAETLKRMFP
jgi:hypothetical protein